MLEVDNLHVRFTSHSGWFGRRSVTVNAVNGVSLTLAAGQTLGIVGESGSGKSTLGRALLKLVPAASGAMQLDGRDIATMQGDLLDFRRDLQVIFQDPYSSLNPAMVIADIVGEPLTIHFGIRGAQRDERVAALLARVGLGPEHLERYPSEFSGGQRQRIAVARALALEPKIIICDEPVSALDVSTQGQVINLLEELQTDFGIAYLFIAHDLAVVRHISHEIGVMYLGRLVELGPAERVHDRPLHPYTQMLLSAVPVPDPVAQKARKAQRRGRPPTEIPDATRMPSGCAFHPRCPLAIDRCRNEVPEPTLLPDGGWVACHLRG